MGVRPDVTCPVPGCSNRMAASMVMCRPHWFSVPKEMRERVWNEYRTAQGSPEHIDAIRDALRVVIEQ